MYKLQGFSLIEVLLSLLLVSTIALTLLEKHLQSKQLLNQIANRIHAMHAAREAHERAWSKS
jgi:prepilin peptidase dependent protein C